MKKLFAAFAGIAVLILSAVGFDAYRAHYARCHVEWSGEIDPDFEKMVAESLDRFCPTLHVTLNSPGGSVITTLSIVERMRAFKAKGRTIEIRGQGLVASGATFILGAGSKGHRSITKNALTLIHGIQTSGMEGQSCMEYKTEYSNEDRDKIDNHLIETLAATYAELSGWAKEDTMTWLNCSATSVGDGAMLVNFQLADRVI